jgi:hypothetical protein
MNIVESIYQLVLQIIKKLNKLFIDLFNFFLKIKFNKIFFGNIKLNMDDPIKVIWKFKNINKKIQYHVCIFLGNIVANDNNMKKILKKIADKNLFDTLLMISELELKTLIKYYGEFWYKHFFNSKHISFMINNIINTKIKQNDIIEKYGKEWYIKHIANFEYLGRTYYNYGHMFKQSMERKNKNIKQKKSDADDNIDYSINLTNLSNFAKFDVQIGGNNEEIINMSDYISGIKNDDKTFNQSYDIENAINYNDNYLSQHKIFGGKKTNKNVDDEDVESSSEDDITDEDVESSSEDNITDEDVEYDVEDDVDEEDEDDIKNDEVDNMYLKRDNGDDTDDEVGMSDKDSVDDDSINLNQFEQEYDMSYEGNDISNEELLTLDENPNQINNMIQGIIGSDISKKYSHITDFDDSLNNSLYDLNLKDVYTKIYIYNQYISKDDTIQTIKNKICCGIKQDPIFGKNVPYLIPSRLYLWSEYEYEKLSGTSKVIDIDKIMLGQKWVRRNELLKISIEPHENLRIYENLVGNLKTLKDNILKYGSRIKKEYDDTNILDEYINYVTNNEIYMLDIYHDLGLNYKADEEIIKNMFNVYVKIYYNISQDEFKQIIDCLNDESKAESNKILQVFQTINNDLLLENEVVKTVEELKLEPEKYNKIFKDNFVTQSVIHVTLQHFNKTNSPKVDLFRVFDNFIVDNVYPFIQFQTQDGKLNYKFYKNGTETDKNAVLSKWFENAPYGISFKIKVQQKGDSTNKYISVNLNENGQLEYKTQWKENDQATIEDVKNTYPFIRNLLNKINSENDKLQILSPSDDKFRYAFINTIQQIELPEKFMINHNDLSDFARYFFPYVAVVVEPRKRQSKIKKKDDKSKYGTYLRYKRISKYENESRIEHRIIYFLRNYEYIEKILTAEISKQFNITDAQALEKIMDVKNKFPNLKKSRKVLKKLDNIPKYKPPGINIDIQGKQRSKYKMRISGARNKYQLDKIINFMNILTYLYVETYLKKNPSMSKLKEKLKQLNNIAKRRNKVEDIVDVDEDIKTVKQITKLDKERLAYKPKKGQNQWTRNCQNSGNDKKRRPVPYTDKTINELTKMGYVYNANSGDYERTVVLNKRGKKKEIILRAAKLTNNDGTHIYYTCSPEENKDHMYVGFLLRSSNPSGLCMPCCFKKDHYTSRNKEKKDYYMKCVGKFQETGKTTKKILGEKLYILQDTNKIQEGRFGYLPRYLDIYFNILLNKTKNIKNHYLVSSKSGYFFKFGSRQDDLPYLHAIASAIDLSVDDIKTKIKQMLTTNDIDRNLQIFTSLNNGDIRTQFETIENYLHFINMNMEIDHMTVDDMLCTPGLLFESGANIFIFDKKVIITSGINSEDVNTKEDYVLLCKNIENVHLINDKNKKNIFLLKEDNNFYPIFMTLKDEMSKNVQLIKAFNYENKNDNIVNHISNYFNMNCFQTSINFMKSDNAKITKIKLDSLNKKSNKYNIIGQIIDQRNKCKYLIIKEGNTDQFMLPVKPSGTIWNIPIYTNQNIWLNTLEKSIEKLSTLWNMFDHNNNDIVIQCKVQGFIYDKQVENKYNIVAIITDQTINLPIQPQTIDFNSLQKITQKNGIKHFIMESRSLYDEIDDEIIKGKDNIKVDKRILNVNNNTYENESYELFRLEVSNYLYHNTDIHQKIENILDNNKINKSDKKIAIKKIIYKFVNKDLYKLYSTLDNNSSDEEMIGGDNDKKLENIKAMIKADEKQISNLVVVRDSKFLTEDKISSYKINNNRDLCKVNFEKESCDKDIHCSWGSGTCKISLTKQNIITFINKMAEELVTNELKSNEILQKDNYFVSDIVNPDRFKERFDQKIIKNINFNIQRILSEIFGKNNIPQIGKNRPNRMGKTIVQDVMENPLEKTGNIYFQLVNNLNSIFRAYTNSFYWLKNIYSDIAYHNLGYYSPLQTDLSNLFKSFIIDYLLNKKRTKKMINDLHGIITFTEQSVSEYLEHFIKSIIPKYISIVDLYILNQLHHIPIILYDIYDQPFVVIDNGIPYIKVSQLTIGNENILNKYVKDQINYINIKLSLLNPSLNSSIGTVYSIYFVKK